MFSELLTPVSELDAFKELIFTGSQLGYNLKHRKWDSQNPPAVALLGIPEGRTSSCLDLGQGSNSIRKQLYNLSGFPNHFNILDLGNIKNGKDPADTFAAVKMIAEELWLHKIPILILGGSQDLTQPLLSGIQKPSLKLTLIDDRIDNQINEKSANDEIYINNLPFRTSIHVIGCQSYFIEQNGHDDIRESFKGHVISLGELRSDIREMEPLLRESDLVSFDFGALKFSEAPGQFRISPNGLTGEEACQLSWYAGMATTPLWFGIFGYNPVLDPTSTGAMIAAQIGWYFLNGLFKKNDSAPLEEATDFIHYHIQVDELDEPISFLKHPVTKRWWMEVPSEDCDCYPLRIACSKGDYRQACKNKIPSRWWKYFNDHNL